MALDEPKESDERAQFGSVAVVVEKVLLDEVGDVTIDFVESGWRSGYRIEPRTPLQKASDGGCRECG